MIASKSEKRIKFQTLKLFLSSFFWQENRTEWPQHFYEIFSNLQLISIVFLESSKLLASTSASEGSLMNIFQNIARILPLIDQSMVTRDSDTATIIFIILCSYFAVFVCLVALAFFQFVNKSKISDSVHSWLIYWTQSHHSLLFFPISIYLISFFAKDPLKKTTIFNVKDTSVGIIAGVSPLIALNNIFALTGALFCYDPFLTKNTFASYNSTFQRLTFVYKAAIGPISLLLDSQYYKWVFIGISISLTFIRYELVLYDSPFYNYSPMRIASLMASIAFSISLAAIIVMALPDSISLTSMDFIFVCIFTALLLLMVTARRIHISIERNISLPISKLKTQQDMFKRIFSLCYLADYSNFFLGAASKRICNRELLYMTGDTLSHASQCKNKRCICHYLMEKDRVATGLFSASKDIKKSKENIKLTVLNQAVKALKNNNILKILYASILLKESKDFLAAQSTICEINRHRSLKDDLLIFMVNQELEKEMGKYMKKTGEKNEKVLNAKLFVDLERDSELLYSIIKQNTKSYLDLWTFYQQSNTTFKDFVSHSINFEVEALEVEKLWQKISTKNQHLPRSLNALYCTYLSIVRNQPAQAENIYNKKERKRIQLQKEDAYDIVVYMSMAKERLGRVLHVSKNIYKELGWTQKEAIGQNISVIQPPFVRERHHQILLRHKENNQGPFNTSFSQYAQNKSGYLIPIDCYVTIFPYVQDEPIYMGIIKTRKLAREVMVIRSDGLIDSVSEGLAKQLDLKQNGKTYISNICKEFRGRSSSNSSKLFERSVEDYIEVLNRERRLTFQVNSLDQTFTAKREATYEAYSQKMTVLGENFFALHMSYKNFEKMLRKRTDRTITTTSQQIMPDDEFEDQIPLECEASPGISLAKGSESQNFSPLLKDRKSRMSRRNTSVLYPSRKTDIMLKTINSVSNRQKAISTSQFEDVSGTKQSEAPDNPVVRKLSSREGSVAAKKRADFRGKIEEAIFLVPRPKYMKLLNYQLAIFAIVCIGLLCFQLANNLDEFNALKQKVEVIANCQKELFTLIIIQLYAGMMYMDLAGIISDKRHATIGISSHLENIKYSFRNYFLIIDSINDQISDNIHLLDKSTQDKIYSYKITPKYQGSPDLNRQVNKFEMVNELANAANTLSRMKSTQLSIFNPQLNFILDNTMNEPVIVAEQIIQDLTDEYESNLYKIKAKGSILLVIALACSLPNIIFFLLRIKEFTMKRNQLLNILNKIDEAALKAHMHLVGEFHNALESHVFGIKTYVKIKHELQKNLEPHELKGTKRKNHYKSKKGLNQEVIKGILLTMLAVVIFVSVFMILAFMFDSNLSDFLVKKTKMLQINQVRIDFVLQNVCFSSYLLQPAVAKVRNNPVEIELERLFAKAASMPDILTELLTGLEGENLSFLQTLLLGNLCRVVINPQLPMIICLKTTEAIGSNGLIGLFSDFSRFQNDMKVLFDQSGHSLQVALGALNSKNQIMYEEIALYMDGGIALAETMLKEDLRQSVKDYRDQVAFIIVAYVFIYMALAWILSTKVWTKIDKARDDWRKVLRQIPCTILSSNKPLKNYLVNDCENILDSYKNMI